MEQRLARQNVVAQIFNLLYRRVALGRTVHLRGCDRFPNTPQIANLRYGRVQLCATSPMRQGTGGQESVAQIFNLPYRRIAFGRTVHLRGCDRFPNTPQIANLRYGRVQRCATSPMRQGTGGQESVAQIFNLPYRRIALGRTVHLRGCDRFQNTPQIANLRYSRVQLCATPAANRCLNSAVVVQLLLCSCLF